MKHLLLITTLYITLILTSCSYSTKKDFDSNLYSVPVGSTLTLNKSITIPANLARRYFQNGIAINEKDINIYYPHCNLLMNTLVDYQRTIEPTTYEIYKIVDDEEHAERPVYFASTVVSDGEGPSIIAYASYYYLRSSVGSDIRSLECLQWDYPAEVEYMSINEIKQSLGDYFTLQIKQDHIK